MNTTEFYNEFNLVYNNLASNQAPGLDKYEISVYLTKAQNMLIDSLYKDFEKSEEARKKLSSIVITAKLQDSMVSGDDHLYGGSKMYNLHNYDIRYVVNEKIKMSSNASMCIKEKFVDVQPVLHDEVDRIMRNPFRFNLRRALRLDVSVDGDRYHEIISKDNHIDYYQIRYIKNPHPIILEELASQGLSIDGFNDASSGELDYTLHRQIVEIAAKLAYADYKNA